MSRAILLVALAVVGYLIYKLYFRSLMQQGSTGKVKIGLIIVGLVFVFLALTGRAPAIFAVLGAGMTMIMRFAPLLIKIAPFLSRYIGGGGQPMGSFGFNKPSAGQKSQVQTRTLLMTLDHDTGAIDGKVLTGEFKGRTLAELSDADVLGLYRYCVGADAEASRLLHAYVMHARSHLEDVARAGNRAEQDHAEQSRSTTTASTGMGMREAREVLGVDDNATKSTVIQAHRGLMMKFHPDKGGSTYLASKINTAKDVLLESLQDG